MSFKDPSDSNFPEIPDGQYRIKCVRIEDGEDGQYGPRMRWVFLLQNAQTEEVISWDDGSPFEWFQNTGTSTGKKSKARPWIEAFIGREITSEDTGAGLANAVIGKYALAMIAENANGYSEIVSIKPANKAAGKAKAKAAPATEPEPEPEPEPVAAGAPAGNPFDCVEDEDTPF